MPGKRRRVGPGRRRATGGGKSRTVRLPFHALNNVTLAAGSFAQPMSPASALSDRLSAITDAFDEYRLVALKYRPRIDATTVANTIQMAFYPGVTTTAPSQTQMGENPYVSMRQTDDDVVLPYTVVPRAVLAGEQPWYKSQKAVITADDSIPGQLFFFGVGTDVILYEVDGVFEFRGEADTANTPLNPKELPHRIDTLNKRVALWNRDIQKQRQTLLKLLNYTETSVVTPQITRWPPPSQ